MQVNLAPGWRHPGSMDEECSPEDGMPEFIFVQLE